MSDYELANDLLVSETLTYAGRQSNLTTKGGLMIHPETTMVTNSNPSKAGMSPKVYNIGERLKGSRFMGDESLPKCNKCQLHHNGLLLHPDWCTIGNAEKRGNAPGNPDANVVTAMAKLVKIDTIIRGCTLNFLDHPFNIDLMPVELGSFDVIIVARDLRIPLKVITYVKKLMSTWPKGDARFSKTKISPRRGGTVGKETVKGSPIVRDFQKCFPEGLAVTDSRGNCEYPAKMSYQGLGISKDTNGDPPSLGLSSAPILALPEGREGLGYYCEHHTRLSAVLIAEREG
ncbi:hypothetical protein Tco_0533906 [Tanacetum coccineum]